MSGLKEIAEAVRGRIECKPVEEDRENWDKCLAAMERNSYVPWDYKESVLRYQEAYFKGAYEECMDMSMVLARVESSAPSRAATASISAAISAFFRPLSSFTSM